MSHNKQLKWHTERVQQTVQINQQGNAVNGFEITFSIPELEETFTVFITELSDENARIAINEFVRNRKAVMMLGSEVEAEDAAE